MRLIVFSLFGLFLLAFSGQADVDMTISPAQASQGYVLR